MPAKITFATMKNSMKRSLLILCMWCMTLTLQAQTKDRPLSLGLWGGTTQYNGDLGIGFYNSDQATYGHFGVAAGYYVAPHWDIAANLTFGSIGYVENQFSKFRGNQTQFNTHFRFNILNSDEHKIIPYALVGIGFAYYEKHSIKPGLDMTTPVGLGVKVRVNEHINLHLQETFAYSDHDTRDGQVGLNNDSWLQHSIGITWNFGDVKDSDKDGVMDKADQCPKTPLGTKVDANGCPLDRDGDGIVDAEDKCPDVKGTIALKGCPDKDVDGITDAEDKCPDIAGIAAFKGCPDTDKDGITDAEDACPSVAGLPALKGCPDKDGDGITDAEDKCPEVAGIAANKGCPEIKEEVKQLFTQALQGIQFESGKEVIRPISFPILDNVVKVMNENPAYLLMIDGHTDNVGKSDFNQELSQKRADAVKNYLASKGIAANRLTATGYGDQQPVDDNNTAAGRAKNRRVAFTVKF